MAKPQSVPTYTLGVPGSNEMPKAPAKPEQPGFDPTGFCQVTPPSVLRQMPPRLPTRLSAQPVAITSNPPPGSSGPYLTSLMRNIGRVSRLSICDQFNPRS